MAGLLAALATVLPGNAEGRMRPAAIEARGIAPAKESLPLARLPVGFFSTRSGLLVFGVGPRSPHSVAVAFAGSSEESSDLPVALRFLVQIVFVIFVWHFVVRSRSLGTARERLAHRLSLAVSIGEPLGRALAGSRSEIVGGWGGLLPDDFDRLVADLDAGTPLADAMAARPERFAPWEVGLARAAERSTDPKRVFEAWGAVVRRFVALESSLRSLAIYPVALLVFSSVVLSVIFWKVYPTFHALTGAVRERPGLLHLAVVAGLSWIGRWADVLLLGLALIAFLLWLLRRNEKGRELTDPLLFLLPGYRAVVLWRGRVTTLEILAAWLSSGAPLDEAVRQAALVQSNARLRTPLLALAGRLAAGGQFGPEGGAPIVDRRTSWAIEAALRSREPAEGCRRLALRERESFDRRLGRTLAWLEPALVLSIGILLGIAIVGTYQPLFETALKVVKE